MSTVAPYAMPGGYTRGLMWFRRDLRVDDNAALYYALRACREVWCVFVFDTDILEPLRARGLTADRRVEFIHASVVALDEALQRLAAAHGRSGVRLLVLHGRAVEEIPRLAAALDVQAVFANHDDEPYPKRRDAAVAAALALQGAVLHTFKDHVVFERREVVKADGKPFAVFTPYFKAWLAQLEAFALQPYPTARYAASLAPLPEGMAGEIPTLQSLGFAPTDLPTLPYRPGADGAQAQFAEFLTRIDRYHETRDYPAVKGVSYLSVHLRFGTISIRQLVAEALRRWQGGSAGAGKWLSELVWREFYHQILANFPHVGEGKAFRPEFDAIVWEEGPQAEAAFAAWCEGRTGYPLVDAAMRQLNRTGYMHNRLRMVAASFLVKDLGIDWRRGEAYFADRLMDYDLANNNGGWQWCASSGCDAQPHFRIFNPVLQSQKFDPHGRFIRRYVPELAALPDLAIHAPWEASPELLTSAGVVLGKTYPRPLVDHREARQRTLMRYAVVSKSGATERRE